MALLTHRVRQKEKKSERGWTKEMRKGRLKEEGNREEKESKVYGTYSPGTVGSKGICEVNFWRPSWLT